MGAEVLIGLGVGAVTSALSVSQAAAQNRAIQNSMNVNAEAAQARQDDYVTRRDMLASQTIDARRMANLQNSRQAQAADGRARAAAAESGLSTGSGSAGRAISVIESTRAFNAGTIESNFGNQMMGINTQMQSQVADNQWQFRAQMAQLASQAQNPFIAGILGGVQGFGTGLQIGGGLGSLADKGKLGTGWFAKMFKG
jgi:hypothetical protein